MDAQPTGTAVPSSPGTFGEALRALPDRVKLPMRFDPSALEADLRQLEASDWTPHFVERNYSGAWSVLPLRAPRGATHPILQCLSHPGTDDWEDTPMLSLCPAFRDVLDSLPCDIGAARLMRLGPGSVIHEHRDVDLAPEYGTVRLHVPVLTNANVDFRLNGTRVTMRAGECWYLRLAERHSVGNRGKTARVHLVIDAQVNPALAAMLLSASQTTEFIQQMPLDDCRS